MPFADVGWAAWPVRALAGPALPKALRAAEIGLGVCCHRKALVLDHLLAPIQASELFIF
jgi:hypothetical protein